MGLRDASASKNIKFFTITNFLVLKTKNVFNLQASCIHHTDLWMDGCGCKPAGGNVEQPARRSQGGYGGVRVGTRFLGNYFCAADYLRLQPFSLINKFIFRENTPISQIVCRLWDITISEKSWVPPKTNGVHWHPRYDQPKPVNKKLFEQSS